MAKYYAWSPIRSVKGDIKVGDVVDPKALEMSEDDFQYLVDTGAVRTKEYPDVNPGESPADYYKRMAAEIAEGNLASLEVSSDGEDTKKEAKG